MARRSLNSGFLTPEALATLGVENSAERNILIHSTCVVLDFDCIRFGSNIRIDPYCTLTCKDLKLGNFIHIAGGSTLSGAGRITIDDFAGISNHCLIFSSSDDYSGAALTNPTVPSKFTNVRTEDIHIHKHVILGARSVVLPGAQLREGASVGANTLVKRELAPWTVYAGVPAVAIRPRKQDCLRLEAELRAELAEQNQT
ncbi:acyltransferase [Phaeobacter porticola]|uniref:Acetyltransferase n=1 Tax=Phaeobacter porticola TaxID=1844006 RepID=A0A1L3I064_9RHOB|nr:acyltransferase [Phaeobacter porticola]APG45519.1 Putative acetyltransferase [Phaeobacter porticola]